MTRTTEPEPPRSLANAAGRFCLESPTLGITVRQMSVAGFRLTESIHRGAARVPEHAHRFPTLYFTLSGSFLEISGGRELTCEPRSVIFRPAAQEHADRIGDTGVRFFILELGVPELCGMLPEWPQQTSVSVGLLSARALSLFHAFRRGDPSLALHAEELCLALVRESPHRAPDLRSATAARVRRAADFIRANFRRPLRVEEIAKVAGVHPVYLARLFRKVQGTSIAEFIRMRRIEDSVRRLLRGEEPITEIALSNGFCDQSHFTREFRREAGHSPARFRAASRRLDAMTALLSEKRTATVS